VALITSRASIARAIDETFGSDNLAPSIGSWRNDLWPVQTPLIWGKSVGKFTLVYPSIAYKFTNISPTIPPEAKIVSAKLRGTATETSLSDGFITLLLVLSKDGIWNETSVGPNWRSTSDNLPIDADVRVLNTSFATLADTLITAQQLAWEIRSNAAGRYLKAGQGVQIVTAGILGYIDITMSRTGVAPAGNIWCEVYSQDGNGLADTLLATSDVRPASAVSTLVNGAPFRFTFSGAQQISLSSGQDTVAVVNGDYPVGTAFVKVHYMSGPVGPGQDLYTPGVFQLYGTGISLDDQNYPTREDFRSIPNAANTFSAWNTPQFIAGVDYDSEDFTGPLQQYFRSGNYAQGDPIAIGVFMFDFLFPPGNVNRKWANFGNPTYTTPTRLIVEWRKRNRQVI
jgi:hypothetical protein